MCRSRGVDEVAGVGPEAGVVEGNDDVARLAGKAGEPLHAFPPFGGVFTSVGVAACEHHGIPAAAAHHRAKFFDSLGVSHISTNIPK